MRQDRIEVPSIKSGLQRRSPRGAARQGKFAHAKLCGEKIPVLDALDEAFAGFARIDGGASRANVHSPTAVTRPGDRPEQVMHRDIMTTLSAQLKALDEQRERLSRLLQTVDELPA